MSKSKKTKAKPSKRMGTGYGAKALVQTVIPKHVKSALRFRAQDEGLTLAAWMRRLLQDVASGDAKGLDKRVARLEERVRRVEMALVRVARGGSFHEPGCPAEHADTTLSDCVCWIAITCAGCGRVLGEDMGHRPDCKNRQPKEQPETAHLGVGPPS